MNKDYSKAEEILGTEYTNVIKNRNHIIRMEYDDIVPLASSGYRQKGLYIDDYVRIRNFELIVEEILRNKVMGSVAELGVFRGEFAKYINWFFPDRKCYLFDTFQGFNKYEAEKEKIAGHCNDAFIEYYENTTIQQVLKEMPNPQNVIIKQGLFPESLGALEDSFAFVSIDVDFEESIYNGLDYFYPRLNPGGYIFIHDYNHKTLKGVKKAVDTYEKKNQILLCKVPICDTSGTLIITKSECETLR